MLTMDEQAAGTVTVPGLTAVLVVPCARVLVQTPLPMSEQKS